MRGKFESVKMNIGADGLFSKFDARKICFRIMLSSRSAQIAVALAAAFVPAQVEAQAPQKATENKLPPIEIKSSLSSGASWFGTKIRISPDSYGDNAQKLIASLFDGKTPKASKVEEKEIMKFLYELGVASQPVHEKIGAITAPPEIIAISRKFHSFMGATAKENPLAEVDTYLGLVAKKPSTESALEALSGSASPAERAKLLLMMARNAYFETSKHNRRSHLARREAASGRPAVGVGDGNEPVAASYFKCHVYQERGNSYCATACALMFALDEAGITPNRMVASDMLEQLASIHSEQVGKGRDGIWSHHMLELMGLNPVVRDYTELNRVDYGNKDGSEKGRQEYA